MNGFIKMHRQMLDWGWYKNSTVKDVFLHCLLKANFTDQNFEGTEIKKGSFVTSYESMASELGLSVQNIRTALRKLQETKEITVKSTNKYTVITVEKWDFFQGDADLLTNNQQTTNKQLTNDQQQRKKEKKDNKDNNIIYTHAREDENTEEKIPFAKYVSMTNDEYKSLIERYGKSDTDRMIEYLDAYKGAHGKKYKDDYRAILAWVVNRLEEEKLKEMPTDKLKQDNFNHEELERLTRINR